MTEQFTTEPDKLQTENTDDNIFSVIRNRRATRDYLPKPVPETIIRSLIDFSIQAPSAMNLQPWSFVVIQNSKILKEISDEVKKKLFNNPDFSEKSGEHNKYFLNDTAFDIFHGASTLIIICAKEKVQKEFNTESDCFLAGENLMLAATGMGLATCPIGLATDLLCEPTMSERFGIPYDFKPVLPIVVGYASDVKSYMGRNPPIIKWVR